jgi:type IV pilus assembly protein PilM
MSRFSFALNAPQPPTVAVEIGAHAVTALSLATTGRRSTVQAHAVEPLPAGALVPSLTGANVMDRAVVSSAVARALAGVGGARRIGLIVPDAVARVSLVRFQEVPARAQDLEQLIRWQVRKAAPFAIEEAQVSFVRGGRTAEGQEFVVSLARRDVIAEYESLCAGAGAQAGLVDLSTFNVINTVLAAAESSPGDWLLVNVSADWTSVAILRGADLIFFRSRGAEGDVTLADLVHQTAMYYEDRLGGSGLGRVLLCGASIADPRQAAEVEWLRRSLEERLATTVEPVDPRRAAALPDGAAATPALLDALAPLVGLLVRERDAA